MGWSCGKRERERRRLFYPILDMGDSMTDAEMASRPEAVKPVPGEPQSPTQPGPAQAPQGQQETPTSPWVEGDPAHDPDAAPDQSA